ncbi:MAG TPA: hypothetical protein VL022_04735 [Moheibacter sp.]|nr:hypothetical protein [Moheibacter sp.]
MKRAIEDVVAERQRQQELWGDQTHSMSQWLAILVEEVGEVAKEVNEFNFEDDRIKQIERLRNYRMELVQVAAVAMQMIEKVDEAAHPLDLRLTTKKEA